MPQPFKLTFNGATPLASDAAYSRLSFTLTVEDEVNAYPLNKIEFDLRPEARGVVSNLYYGTVRKGPSYQTYPGQGLVFKITQIKGAVPVGPAGVDISFTVPSAYSTLQTLFASLQYSPFTSDQKGCPLGLIVDATAS